MYEWRRYVFGLSGFHLVMAYGVFQLFAQYCQNVGVKVL